MTSASIEKGEVSQLTKGYMICLVATFAWASTGIFIRYLTETYRLPALALAYWRDMLVGVGVILVLVLFKPVLLHLERRHWLFMMLYGLILATFNTLWTFSVALNGAAVSTVLAYSSAAFTAVLAWWLLGESLGLLKGLAVILGVGGCVLVAGAYDLNVWRLNPFGIITGLFSGVAFAAYSLIGKYSSNRGINSWTAMAYTFSLAAFLLLMSNIIVEALSGVVLGSNLFWLEDQWLGWGFLIVLALGPTVGGYGLYTLSMAYLPASVANLIAMLEPPLTAVMAYLLLGEILTPLQLVGGALIISCVVIVRLSERGNNKQHNVSYAP
jgi:DME family drug/metabolite transporter